MLYYMYDHMLIHIYNISFFLLSYFIFLFYIISRMSSLSSSFEGRLSELTRETEANLAQLTQAKQQQLLIHSPTTGRKTSQSYSTLNLDGVRPSYTTAASDSSSMHSSQNPTHTPSISYQNNRSIHDEQKQQEHIIHSGSIYKTTTAFHLTYIQIYIYITHNGSHNCYFS